MDRNKLAALANELGGLDELADELGINQNILESAINGESLTRFDRSEIDIAYAKFEQDNDESYLQYIDETAEILQDSINLTNDYEIGNHLTNAFANGNISKPQLNDLYTLWGNLTTYQSSLVADWLDSKDANAAKLTELYLEESDLFDNYEDSEFWEWFRDTFYND